MLPQSGSTYLLLPTINVNQVGEDKFGIGGGIAGQCGICVMEDIEAAVRGMSIGELKVAMEHGGRRWDGLEKAQLQAEVIAMRCAGGGGMRNEGNDQDNDIRRILDALSLYDVLNVKQDADETAIKRSYRKLVLRVHPDKTDSPDAESAFKHVQKAYETLLDADERAKYNLKLAREAREAQPSERGRRESAGRASSSTNGETKESKIDPRVVEQALRKREMKQALGSMKEMLIHDPDAYYNGSFKQEWLAPIADSMDPFDRQPAEQQQAAEVCSLLIKAFCGQAGSGPELPPHEGLIRGLCNIIMVAGENRTREALHAIDILSKVPVLWDAHLFLMVTTALLTCSERVAHTFAWAPYDSLLRLTLAQEDQAKVSSRKLCQAKLLTVESVLVPALITRITLTSRQAQARQSTSSVDTSSFEVLALLCQILDVLLTLLEDHKVGAVAQMIFEPLQSVIVAFNSVNTMATSSNYSTSITRDAATNALATIHSVLQHTSNDIAASLAFDFFTDLSGLLAGLETYHVDDEEGDNLIIQACTLLSAVSERMGKDFTAYGDDATFRLFNILGKRPPPSVVHAPIIRTFGQFALSLGNLFERNAGPTTDMLAQAILLVSAHASSNSDYAIDLLREVAETITALIMGSEHADYLGTPFLDMVCSCLETMQELCCDPVLSTERSDLLQQGIAMLGDLCKFLTGKFKRHVKWQGSQVAMTVKALLKKAEIASLNTESTKYGRLQFEALQLPQQQPIEHEATSSAGVAVQRRIYLPTVKMELSPHSMGTRDHRVSYHSICMMHVYTNESPEEMRYRDYLQGIRGPSSVPTDQSNPFAVPGDQSGKPQRRTRRPQRQSRV